MSSFSYTEVCVNMRPRTAMAFLFLREENLRSHLTYKKMAEPIELCEDGSEKTSSFIYLIICSLWFSCFPLSVILSDQMLDLDGIFMILVFSHIFSIYLSFCYTFCEISFLNVLLSCWIFFNFSDHISNSKNLFIDCSFFYNNLFLFL